MHYHVTNREFEIIKYFVQSLNSAKQHVRILLPDTKDESEAIMF